MLQVVWKMGKVVHLWDKCAETQPELLASQLSKINFSKHIIESNLFSRIVSFTFPPAQSIGVVAALARERAQTMLMC